MGRKRDESCFSQSSSLPIAISLIICFFLVASCSCSPLVTKEDRKILERTDNGEISAIDVDVDDGCNRNSSYYLEFISMEPNSLFLPVFLHTDVAFYVQTGEGTVVSWIKKDDEDGSLKKTHVDVGCGDMYRIGKGSFFYIQTRSDPMRTKLRISALFVNQCMPEKKKTEGSSTTFGRRHPYSNVADLLRGFDIELLGEGFNVSEVELNPIIKLSEKPPSIIPYTAVTDDNSDNSKPPLNIHKKKPDVKNRHGWTTTTTTTTITTDVGGFMVNLTQGSIVAPHWNPTASEISIVTEGEGMIQIVYPTSTTTVRLFKVKVGDVFVVPRYHPMVQISFRNSSLVLVGFTTVGGENNNLHPKFLAGTGSVLRMLDQQIVAMGFNVGSTAVGKIFSSVDDAVLLDCTYCAEEMETKMRRDADKRQKQEEEKRKEKERQKQEERRRKEGRKEEEEEKERREKAEKRQREEEEEEERREKEQKKKEERHRKRKKQREEEESRRRDEEEKVKRREEKEEEERHRKRKKKKGVEEGRKKKK